LGESVPVPLVVSVTGAKQASSATLDFTRKLTFGDEEVMLPLQPAKAWPGSGMAVML